MNEPTQNKTADAFELNLDTSSYQVLIVTLEAIRQLLNCRWDEPIIWLSIERPIKRWGRHKHNSTALSLRRKTKQCDGTPAKNL